MEVNAASTNMAAKMNINQAHALLDHGDVESTQATAQMLGWTSTHGTPKSCLYCATAKAKQKNVVKESRSSKATKPEGRVYLDLLSVRVPKSYGSEFAVHQTELENNW